MRPIYVTGLDPGPKITGFARVDLVYNTGPAINSIVEWGDIATPEALTLMDAALSNNHAFAIETLTSYKKRVGAETFDTLIWVGRLQQHAIHCGIAHELISRKHVKGHVLRDITKGDPEIKKAMIARFGGRAVTMGTPKNPGPWHGKSSHAMAALATAVTYVEKVLKR